MHPPSRSARKGGGAHGAEPHKIETLLSLLVGGILQTNKQSKAGSSKAKQNVQHD